MIQISSCLVIFGAANMFITQFCGPAEVTTYNIAYKFFNLLVIAYTIILSPMWNAYTDAYVKSDMKWIEQTFNRALKLWGLSVTGGFIMLAGCQIFYHYGWEKSNSAFHDFTMHIDIRMLLQSEQLCDIPHKWSEQNTNPGLHILGIHCTLYCRRTITRQTIRNRRCCSKYGR